MTCQAENEKKVTLALILLFLNYSHMTTTYFAVLVTFLNRYGSENCPKIEMLLGKLMDWLKNT